MAAGALVQTSKNQQGLALLVLVIVVILAFAAYSLSGLSINRVKADQAKKTRVALKQAKAALVAHAITHADSDGGEMGYLPCTSSNNATNEGGSDGGCGGAANINASGYFPWASLETGILRDNSGTCLRYIVSGSYKNSPYSGMINEDSEGMLDLVDAAGTKAVALVFAPGEPLTGQVRNFDNTSLCGNDDNMANYLEGDGSIDNGVLNGVADVNDSFIHATVNSESAATPYNDQFLAITRDEIWEPILSRSDFLVKMENLTQALAMCLASYANLTDNARRRLPWPAVTNLQDNDYRDNASYQDNAPTTVPVDHGYSGRFPFDITNSNNEIDDVNLTIDTLFDMAGCNALVLTGAGAGVIADLQTTTSEYRKLWNNWKDHFFYVLSKDYEPDSTGVEQQCIAGGGGGGSGSCIEVNWNNHHAAAVIFSGRRLAGVTRADKSNVADYLENDNATVFDAEALDKTGDRNYIYTGEQTDLINDIMYCVQDKASGINLDVVECPL